MIAIGCDHGGFELKQAIMAHLTERGDSFHDYGTYTSESCDYPKYAKLVAKAVASGECSCGILICGTGIGVSITAKRSPASAPPSAGTAFPPRRRGSTTTPISWPWAPA